MVSTTQTTDIAGDTLKISKKTKPIVEDLEIKDAQMIFNTIWTELGDIFNDEKQLVENSCLT